MAPLFNIQTFKFWRNNKHRLLPATDRTCYEVLETFFDQSVEFEKLFFTMHTQDQHQLLDSIWKTLDSNVEKYKYRKD